MLFVLVLEIKTSRALPYHEQGPRFYPTPTERRERTDYVLMQRRSVAVTEEQPPAQELRELFWGDEGGMLLITFFFFSPRIARSFRKNGIGFKKE